MYQTSNSVTSTNSVAMSGTGVRLPTDGEARVIGYCAGAMSEYEQAVVDNASITAWFEWRSLSSEAAGGRPDDLQNGTIVAFPTVLVHSRESVWQRGDIQSDANTLAVFRVEGYRPARYDEGKGGFLLLKPAPRPCTRDAGFNPDVDQIFNSALDDSRINVRVLPTALIVACFDSLFEKMTGDKRSRSSRDVAGVSRHQRDSGKWNRTVYRKKSGLFSATNDFLPTSYTSLPKASAPTQRERILPIENNGVLQADEHRLLKGTDVNLRYFSRDDVSVAMKMIEDPLSKATVGKHIKVFELWCKFLTEHGAGDDHFLDKMTSDTERATALSHFVMFLSDSHGRREEEVASMISSLNSNFTTAHRAPFNKQLVDSIMGRWKKATKRTEEEVREKLAARRSHEKLPVVPEMLLVTRKTAWETVVGTKAENRILGVVDAKQLDDMGSYLGMIATFETVARAGNWASDSKKCVKAREMCFMKGDLSPGGRTTYKVIKVDEIRELVAHLTGPGRTLIAMLECLEVVAAVRIDLLDTKMGKTVCDIFIGRRSKAEEELLQDMMIWVILGGVKSDQPFLSRWGVPKGKKSTVSRSTLGKDITNAVRLGARLTGEEEVWRFSKCSLRSGARTTMDSALEYIKNKAPPGDEELTNQVYKRGGWASKVVSNKHYNFNLPSNLGGRAKSFGPLSIMHLSTFTLEKLRSGNIEYTEGFEDMSGGFEDLVLEIPPDEEEEEPEEASEEEVRIENKEVTEGVQGIKKSRSSRGRALKPKVRL